MCKQKIPIYVKCHTLEPDTDTVINTHSLDCIVKSVEGQLFIKARSGEANEDAFPVSAGESIELSGDFTVFAKEKTKAYCLFYSTL